VTSPGATRTSSETIHFEAPVKQDPRSPQNVNHRIDSELPRWGSRHGPGRDSFAASFLLELTMRPTFLAVLAFAAVACRPAPPAVSDADKATIRALGDSFVVFFHTNRDSAIAALYTENAVMMPPNHGPVEGRAAIRAFFEAYPALPDFAGTPLEVEGRGDLAYVRGTYAFSVPAGGGQPAMSDHGKFVEIRRRQPDGKWLVSVDIFNSDVPLPAR
jgi:ketosteroid isomerase-like protein